MLENIKTHPRNCFTLSHQFYPDPYQLISRKNSWNSIPARQGFGEIRYCQHLLHSRTIFTSSKLASIPLTIFTYPKTWLRSSFPSPSICFFAPWKKGEHISSSEIDSLQIQHQTKKNNNIIFISTANGRSSRGSPSLPALGWYKFFMFARSSSRKVRIRVPDFFSVVYFSRGILPTQKRNGKEGHLAG